MKKFREYHLERLKNPEDAQEYLDAALELYEEDGDKEAFFTALRDSAEFQEELTKLAQRTHINPQNLYRILSEKKTKTRNRRLHFTRTRLSFKHRISSLS